tara:strand:- start:43 stop:2352 length:2310 start_codon:yes stop_codon:yes gene_type:complete
MNNDLSEDPIYKAYQLDGGKLGSFGSSESESTESDPLWAAYQKDQKNALVKPDASAEAPAASIIARLNRSTGSAEEPEPTWGEAAQVMGKQVLPSYGRAIKETAKALTVNLPETIESFGQIGKGLYSKGVGALGFEQDPEEKQKTEELADAMGHEFSKLTTSAGIKKQMMEDPASLLSILSLPFSGGVGLLSKVAKTGSLAQKALALTAKGAQYLDPMQAALGTAKLAVKPITAVAKHSSALAAQVPSHVLDIAQKAGSTSDPVLRKAFLDHFNGSASPTDILDTAQSALSSVKSQASKDYLNSKAGWSASQATPSFNGIDQALIDARKKVQYLNINNPNLFPSANEALNKAESLVSSWKSNQAAHTIEGFDNLKQALWDVSDDYKSNNQARQAMGGVYNATRKAIGDISPKYLDAMEKYQSSLNEISSIQKGLISGQVGKADAFATVNKILRKQKSPQGKKLIDLMSEQNPEFAYKIAGATLAPWTQSGHRGMLEALASGLGGVGGYALAGHPLGAIGGALGSMAVQAPKVTGAVNYATGVLGRKLDSPLARGAMYTAEQLRPGEEGEAPTTPTASVAPVSSNDNLFETRIVPIESGGRQSSVSPKGAIGVSQIMPSTGPEAAALAGEPWSLERLKTDADYNLKLGKAYFNDLVKTFGDPTVAAAAYNAGKGRVAEALKVSEKTGRNWVSLLPPETQNYVRKFTQAAAAGGRIGRASGGRAVNHADMAEKLVRQAERVKKVQGEGTEALLDHQDDAIVSALEIANRHI